MDDILYLKTMLMAQEQRADGLSLTIEALKTLASHREEELRAEIEKQKERVKELEDVLRWYVKNDDTAEASYNQPWLDGKRRAQKLLGEDCGEYDGDTGGRSLSK